MTISETVNSTEHYISDTPVFTMLSVRRMPEVPSGLTGESRMAQNAARQYVPCTSIVAMSGEAIIVMIAEATTSVRT